MAKSPKGSVPPWVIHAVQLAEMLLNQWMGTQEGLTTDQASQVHDQVQGLKTTLKAHGADFGKKQD